MTQQEMSEKAKLRPKNFWELTPKQQWEIDKELGILDWVGSPVPAFNNGFDEDGDPLPLE